LKWKLISVKMKYNIDRIFYIVVALFLLLICCGCDQKEDIQIINMFEEIDSIPVSISFQNKLDVNNNGGHLQGVQYYKYNQKEYFFLSGSSDSNSYYAVLKMGVDNTVISVNNILPIPYKHAGGFQISNNLMAIGVEDNRIRNKSKVFIYRVVDPENLPKEPLKIVDRFGTIERATAGCVGIIEIRDYVLMIVGDWNTEHLDFYKIKKERIGIDGDTFELVYSINIENLDKSDWINDIWHSYQNINIIRDESDNLYLAGMASNGNGKNILDLYRIETEDSSTFNLKKILTKQFVQSDESNFNLGAGLYVIDDGNLKIFSCGSHIQEVTRISIYE